MCFSQNRLATICVLVFLANATLVSQNAAAQIFVVQASAPPPATPSIAEYGASGGTVQNPLIPGLTSPLAIATDGTNLFIPQFNDITKTTNIAEYSTSGVSENPLFITGLGSCEALTVSGSNLFLMNGTTLAEYTTSGVSVNPSLVTGLNNVLGIAVSGTNIYFTNNIGGTVGEYTTSTATLNASLISGLNNPAGIAVSGSNLFVVSSGNSVTLKNGQPISGNGAVGEYMPNGQPLNTTLIPNLIYPWGVSISGSDMFVTSWDTGTIAEYDTSDGVLNPSFVSGLSAPYGIAVVPEPSSGIILVISVAVILSFRPRKRNLLT